MEKNNQIIQTLLSRPAWLLLLSGLVPISLALISQYFYGMHPCELCIYQRVPFAVVIFLGVLSVVFVKKPIILKASLALAVIAYLINTGIAFFHVGVEKNWWDFGECTANLDMSSIENLRNALFNAPNVRCDDVQFSFMGLSMAGWNVVYCIIAAIFFYNLLRKQKR